MTRIIALVALVVLGGIIGAFAYSQLSGEASAAPGCPPKCPTPTPAPPQQREDQIPVASGEFRFEQDVDWRSAGSVRPALTVAIDAADYPDSANFRLEVGVERLRSTNTPTAGCVRLFDTTGGAVAGSEMCWSVPVGSGRDNARIRSDPFSLPPGEHEYDVEGKTTLGIFFLHEIRIIAEWTE